MAFGINITEMAMDAAKKADLNHNHIPDIQELQPVAETLGDAFDDVVEAIDTAKVGAGWTKISKAVNAVEVAGSKVFADGIQASDAPALFADPKVQLAFLEIFVGLRDIKAGINEAQFAKAWGEGEAAGKIFKDYLAPMKAAKEPKKK